MASCTLRERVFRLRYSNRKAVSYQTRYGLGHAGHARVVASRASLAVHERHPLSVASSDLVPLAEESVQRHAGVGRPLRGQPVRARMAAIRVRPRVRQWSRRVELCVAAHGSAARLPFTAVPPHTTNAPMRQFIVALHERERFPSVRCVDNFVAFVFQRPSQRAANGCVVIDDKDAHLRRGPSARCSVDFDLVLNAHE
jgi:hypothetical protein